MTRSFIAYRQPRSLVLSNGITVIREKTSWGAVPSPASCSRLGAAIESDAIPANTVLLVEWGDDAYNYAIEHQYQYLTYTEGFNG